LTAVTLSLSSSAITVTVTVTVTVTAVTLLLSSSAGVALGDRVGDWKDHVFEPRGGHLMRQPLPECTGMLQTVDDFGDDSVVCEQGDQMSL
jgi:hypothetical protein